MALPTTIPPRYDDSVFINCPFDDAYGPILRAIVFAVYDCGFIPRCALEVTDSGSYRLGRILDIISECKYGIHDISRTELSRANLPRFNMPFECGLYWGAQHFGAGWHAEKHLLVLDSVTGQYQDSLSDIAGQDIKVHGDDASGAVKHVRNWLTSNSGRLNIPGGTEIWNHYQKFLNELPLLLVEARITRAELDTLDYYFDYTKLVEIWLRINEARARESGGSRQP